ncbi:GNAT family N-acetyltransferase [Pontixanthobacter sp.]|uniref:GNAT family N-acetyltransferase n=1 Tax=Pontixanthobacter sp. TaxID=2792078 RepID=UPI003C7A1937
MNRDIQRDALLPAAFSDFRATRRIEALELRDIGPSLICRWQTLAAHSAEPNPFFEPWMLIPALRAFPKPGAVKVLAYYDGDVLSGLIPVSTPKLYYGRPIPHWASWLHDNVFCGVPLVLPGSEKAFLAALLEWMQTRYSYGLFLHLSHIPQDGPFYTALRQQCGDHGLTAAVVHREKRAMLKSSQRPEEYYAASLSCKKRKELRRLANRLGEQGAVSFSRHGDADRLTEWTAQFLALEAEGWKGRDGSALASDAANKTFFEQTLTGAAKANRLERLTLSLDQRPIAMLVNFITPPGAYSFKTTFDENYARYSPGVLLQRENLDLLSNKTVEWTDSCAAADHPMIERIWREKRSMVKVNIGIGGAVRHTMFRQMIRCEASAHLLGT